MKLKSLLKSKTAIKEQQELGDLTKGAGSASRLRIANDVYFYVVTKARSGDSEVGDIFFKVDPIGFANQIRGGLKPEEIVIITSDVEEARAAAYDQIEAPDSEEPQQEPAQKGKSKYYQNNRQFVREQGYMGNRGDSVYMTEVGTGDTAHYVLLNRENYNKVDMIFTTPEEVAAYSKKQGLKITPYPHNTPKAR